MTTTAKTATSGGQRASGSTPPAPPAPPPAPPFGDGDDRFLTDVEVYDLLRLPEEKRVYDAIKDLPHVEVNGEKRWLKGQTMSVLAQGGVGNIKSLGKRPRRLR